MYYQPRDIGCNRQGVYENNQFVRTAVKSGFYFKDHDTKDLLNQILLMNTEFVLEHLNVIESGPQIYSPKRWGHVTHSGVIIGYVNRESV